MSKKGEFVTVFAVVGLLVVAGGFVVGSAILGSSEGYVGDVDDKIYYDASCAPHIQEKVIFQSGQDAEKLGFTYAKCP